MCVYVCDVCMCVYVCVMCVYVGVCVCVCCVCAEEIIFDVWV